ncbi:MAG: hypothetical protein ACQESD_06160 [Thermoplasmatota archaeon]
MTSKAFCPGHITGFFTLPEEKQPFVKTGSMGAGFSIGLGATSKVDVGGEGWTVKVNGEKTSFLVVEKTLLNIAKGGEVEIDTDVPFSQGFGMSGACALSAAMAALEDTGSDTDRALKLAHRSEVFCRTGLGDVIAQYNGGFEIRKKGGLPPHGEIEKQTIDKEVVLAVLGLPLITPDILADVQLAEWIKAIGGDLMEEYLPENGFDRFIDFSLRFAEETQFIKNTIRKGLNAAEPFGKGSMSMIGNSVFFFGDITGLKTALEAEAGEDNVYLTEIDNEGARIIE